MADQAHPGPTGAPAPGNTPDIEKLAERVYRLLLADLRLDRARTGTGLSRGRG